MNIHANIISGEINTFFSKQIFSCQFFIKNLVETFISMILTCIVGGELPGSSGMFLLPRGGKFCYITREQNGGDFEDFESGWDAGL